MDKQEIIKKIISKKEFSQLPEKDVETAFEMFNRERYSDDEKVKMARDLLRKVFSVFTSRKLLKRRDYEPDWILKKHISTKERYKYYEELYNRILRDSERRINVIDLGAGVNGFSYRHFPVKVYYTAVEAIGQLVDLMNRFFNRERFDALAIHKSLFDIGEIKELIKNCKGEKIIFLLKVIDSLEMMKRNYSKKLLLEITPLADKIVVSFAMQSLVARKKFRINRNWIVQFIDENFAILEDFVLGEERYLIFRSKVRQ